MKKLIINQEDFDKLCLDIRNRKYEETPILVDFGNCFEHIEPIDWSKEYVTMERINDIDVINIKNY